MDIKSKDSPERGRQIPGCLSYTFLRALPLPFGSVIPKAGGCNQRSQESGYRLDFITQFPSGRKGVEPAGVSGRDRELWW